MVGVMNLIREVSFARRIKHSYNIGIRYRQIWKVVVLSSFPVSRDNTSSNLHDSKIMGVCSFAGAVEI